MAKYTIELTEVEDKAMWSIANTPQDWIENVVKNRARKAINEIYKSEVERMTNDPDITIIPADKNQVVLDADVPTWKERSDAMENK